MGNIVSKRLDDINGWDRSIIVDMATNDITYKDGSKDYCLFSDEYIHIDRPEVVKIIETILTENHTGWSYMKQLDVLSKSGHITQEEYRLIVKILD